MRFFLTLFFITSFGYSIYRYPELYGIIADIAMDKAKSEMAPLKKKTSDWMDALDNTAVSYCNRVGEGVDDCKETIACYKAATMNFGQRMTSVDSLYAMVASQNKDTMEQVREKVLPGDIYDIDYEINYHGRCMSAHSRSLGKPHISGSSIRYTLPTGQKYHFAMPEGEGTITLRSAELVRS